MKKIIITALIFLCAPVLFAQGAAKNAFPQEDMRIFVKEGEEAITRFPSKYLDSYAKVNIVFPKGYETFGGRYATVYIIGESFDKERAEAVFSKTKLLGNAVFVSVNITGGGNIGAFLTQDLFPHMDLNYKTDSRPQSRIVAAAGLIGFSLLEYASLNPGYFSNAAVILQSNTSMPSLTGSFTPDFRVYITGRIGNVAAAQEMLENKNLKFLENFASNIFTAQGNDIEWGRVNLDYLAGPAPSAVKAGIVLGADKISPEDGNPVDFRLDIKTDKGQNFVYIPKDIKFSPPFLMWDRGSAQLKAIYGATPGKVKISGPLYFYNKGFSAKIKVI